VPASAEVALPRSVSFAGGIQVRVGEPPPSDLGAVFTELPFLGRGWALEDRATVLFEGASSASVRIGAGNLVHSVTLHFDDAAARNVVLARLADLIGREGPRWENRTTEISLGREGLTIRARHVLDGGRPP
jgi:hypothetical protein